jgi:hypothetical protein
MRIRLYDVETAMSGAVVGVAEVAGRTLYSSLMRSRLGDELGAC